MDISLNALIFLLSFLACLSVSLILFHFMDAKYERRFRAPFFYSAVKVISALLCSVLNISDFSLLTLITWIILTGLSVRFLYREEIDRPVRRIITCTVLLLYLCICEVAGNILMRALMQADCFAGLGPIALTVLEIIFTRICILLMYTLILNKLLGKKQTQYSKKYLLIHTIILTYSLINLLSLHKISQSTHLNYLYVLNAGCCVIADLYLLYFINAVNEKNLYENQIRILEQQTNMQYQYYLAQSAEYEKIIRILHDVDKHIRTIENLYSADRHTAAIYAGEIREMLKLLIPVKYTGNPILDILLADQEALMKEKDIAFEIKTDQATLDFIKPIDTTTIFGNLLDNAREAAEKVDGPRFVRIRISSYHKMITLRIENSSNDVNWNHEWPVSQKEAGHGIGLINVKNSIEKYHGDIKFNQKDGLFVTEIFLNH